jgi:protein-S-isoprenylcysteine O-methyltransferase Ste14
MKKWHVPPPLLFLLTYIAGEVLDKIASLRFAQIISDRTGGVVGVLLLFAGVVLVATSVATFKRARTTVIPYSRAATLVTQGPYRFTRNPMYVGVAFFYLGVAALRLALWPVLLLPLVLVILNYVVIPQEEFLLRDTFGAEYERYSAKVRRWL